MYKGVFAEKLSLFEEIIVRQLQIPADSQAAIESSFDKAQLQAGTWIMFRMLFSTKVNNACKAITVMT